MTRLKEGANAHRSVRNRWESSLAAGWWRPVSALPAVSRDAASMSTHSAARDRLRTRAAVSSLRQLRSQDVESLDRRRRGEQIRRLRPERFGDRSGAWPLAARLVGA